MTGRTRIVVVAIAGFVAALVLGVMAGRILGADDEGTAAIDPVVVPVPVGGDDFDTFADAYASAVEEARAAASALGEPLGPSGSASGAPVHETSDLGAATDDPTAFGPPGFPTGSSTAAVDGCIGGGADCPYGIGGTVLLAIREIPPFVGYALFSPPPPGSGSVVWSPECPPAAAGVGVPVLGASTSRPATITVDYRAGARAGTGYEVQGTVTYTTPDADEAGWNSWIADDAASATDPRSWITHCVTLPDDLPPRTDYLAFIRYADKYEPSFSVPNRATPLRFTVLGPDGVVPGAERRPTFLLGYGIDDLRIGVTRTADQEVQAVALAGADAGSCDTGGDEASVFGSPGARIATILSDQTIPADVLADPGYLWDPDYTESVVLRIGLQEGTDFRVCIYWMEAGPSFDARVVAASEEVVVSTPEAYRPRLILTDVVNTVDGIDQALVTAAACTTVAVDLVADRTGAPDMTGAPRELCTLQDELTEADRGIRFTVAVRQSDGTFSSHRPFVRTNLECDTAPCRLRLDELAVVPLPPVPVEESQCGSGFGSGCLSGSPTRSAGDALVRIVFVDVPGNGLDTWSIGEVSPFDVSPGELGETPQMDADVVYELRGTPADPVSAARAEVTVVADRPITLRATAAPESLDGAPGCSHGAVTAYEGALAETHTFTLEPLCLGSGYALNLEGADAAGTPAVIVTPRVVVVGTTMRLSVPPVLGGFTMTATGVAPLDGQRYRVRIGQVLVHPLDLRPHYSARLGWLLTAEAEAANRAAGWNPLSTYDEVAMCSAAPGAGPVDADVRMPRRALVGQENVVVEVEMVVTSLHPVGGIYGECAVDRVVDTVTVRAVVGIIELRAGFTLISPDGHLALTIRMTDWRSDLVG